MNSPLTAVPIPSPTPSAHLLAPATERDRSARDRRRALVRNLRRALLGVSALGTVVAVGFALRPRPIWVDVARATKGTLTVEIEESGATRIKDRYVVSLPVTGRVARSSLEPGDSIEERSTLAEVAPLESPLLDERTRAEARARVGAAVSALGRAKAEVARARAAHEQAQKDAGRARWLSAQDAVSRQELEQAEFTARMRAEELDSAQFGAKVAEEELRMAQVALGRDRSEERRDQHVDVLSPISGKVLRVHQKSAAVLPAGTPLLEVGDPSALEVVVDLLTTDAVQVRPGTEVLIERWGGDHAIRAKVHSIEPSAFTRPSALGVDEQRVNVIVAFTDPIERWRALGDGFRVEARLTLWRGDGVLKVPHGAVFRHGDGWAVFRLDGATARRIPVSVGHRGEKEVEVTGGLEEGAWVAVHPGDRVNDGVQVKRR